ncbi:N-acetylmuramoyl-L-alanine amidase [Rudanella lutea]|uniref:N-acetylmuramoyl-L-alanine amidase n=1 Tax=Rudanella lutea TaxID=451374 RepID=UPI000379EBA0|nr:N-acetylmuramoyl-L-alanine amidase [Rudanella lutea]
MKPASLTTYEQSFFDTGLDSMGRKHILTPTTVPIPGESGKLTYIRCGRENGDTSFFFDEEITKTNIVLHYTAGYLKGDIASLTAPSQEISVPFVIARDGRILNLWSSKYWSYHLGPGAVGGNTAMSKRTIAIEISNIGFLNKIGNNLCSDNNSDDIYCSLTDTAHFKALKTPFRGKSYFATFTSKQYDSLIVLLRYLTRKYNIKRAFLPEPERYSLLTESRINGFSGILTHANFRPDKLDIGPAFEWERVIKGLK